MSAYQENLFQSRSKKTAFSFICRINLEKYFIKAREDVFRVYITSSKHEEALGEVETVMQMKFDYSERRRTADQVTIITLNPWIARALRNTKSILNLGKWSLSRVLGEAFRL